MAVQQYYVSWLDAGGNYRQTQFLWDTFVGSSNGLPGALNGISNAGLISYVYGPPKTDESTEPGTALFPSANDIATLVYAASDGSQSQLIIPAPIAGIFQPDTVTVNPLSVAMIAFNSTALNGALTTPNGGTVTTFLAGVRGRRNA